MNVKKVFVVIFLVVLFIPFSFAPFYNSDISYENRSQVEFPNFGELRFLDFTKKLKFFFKSEFAFRDVLIKSYLYLKEEILLSEALPNKIKQGKDDWLFLGNSYENVFNESLGVINHQDDKINAIFNNIKNMNSLCKERGVDFYFVVVADKHRIYPEKLPLNISNSVNRRLELIKAKNAQFGEFKFIDISEKFLKSKNSKKIYYHTDSHWTPYGALLGTRTLLDTLSNYYSIQNELCDIGNYKVDSLLLNFMDLSKIIYKKYPEYKYEFTPLVKELQLSSNAQRYNYTNTINNLNVVIFPILR